jgi:hypothetical protein
VATKLPDLHKIERVPWDPEPRYIRPEVVIDQTVAAKAVMDLFKGLRPLTKVTTVTSGTAVHQGAHVPKQDLIAALEVPFHTQTLKVLAGLKWWKELREELLSFKHKKRLINPGVDKVQYWRESANDDSSWPQHWRAGGPADQA